VSAAVFVMSLRVCFARRWAALASRKVLKQNGYGMMWE
jgi:hypothetical protein